MNLIAAAEMRFGGPGSGRHPEGGRKRFSKEELGNFIRRWRYPMGANGFGDPSDTTRAQAKTVLKETLPGGSLEHLHPGSVTVYRGYDEHKVSKGGVSSFSTDKGYARGYGKNVRQLTLSKNTPALSMAKAGHLGSEVLVHEN